MVNLSTQISSHWIKQKNITQTIFDISNCFRTFCSQCFPSILMDCLTEVENLLCTGISMIPHSWTQCRYPWNAVTHMAFEYLVPWAAHCFDSNHFIDLISSRICWPFGNILTQIKLIDNMTCEYLLRYKYWFVSLGECNYLLNSYWNIAECRIQSIQYLCMYINMYYYVYIRVCRYTGNIGTMNSLGAWIGQTRPNRILNTFSYKI